MNDNAKHVLVFRDSEIKALHIANLLKYNNINPIMKNEFQQALLSGFGANYEESVEVWVSDHEVEKAKEIIESENNKATQN